MSEGDADQPQPDGQPQDAPAPAPAEGPRARAELPAPAAGPGSGPGADRDQRKGGDAAGLAAGDAPTGDKPGSPPNVADRAEENLDERSDDSGYQARRLRADVPDSGADLGSSGDQAAFNFNGTQTTVGNVAGRDMYHQYYSFYAEGKERARGPISIAHLTRFARVHVRTDSDDMLQMMCGADRVVLLRGRRESGRRSSAVRILDALTGGSRGPSLVSVVEANSGLDGLARRLAEGHGHLLDASAEDWPDAITEAQVVEIRAALEKGRGGYLIVIADASTEPPQHVTIVDHVSPAPGQVVVAHIADALAGDAAITDAGSRTARALLEDALDASPEAREWHKEILAGPAPGEAAAPAEAVHLAMAVVEWGRRPRADGASEPPPPRIRHYRNLRLYRQARALLGRGDRSDSPLRQAYVIATAVLDGMAVSEVADGARQLAAALEEVEGGSRKRRVFAETQTHWLGHADMVASVTEADGRGTAGAMPVVRMPSRRLARTIIEVAWLDYDAARVPLRRWLVQLCGEHPDTKIRIRAAQALAFIAACDYRHIKSHVLDVWADSGRPVEHQAAAWLLEAATTGDPTGGRVPRRVQELLRLWSRSGQRTRRAIAVRAYGTKVGMQDPDVALMGIRISAADPGFRALPELSLAELYADGLREKVLDELLFWSSAYPVMRERVGRALVRVSWLRLGEASRGSYDLLWRLAHEPKEAGVELDPLAGLWKIACQQDGSRRAAWNMLGLWAVSCRGDAEQQAAFLQLVDSFERTVDRADLRERFQVYRRRWNDYLGQEDTR